MSEVWSGSCVTGDSSGDPLRPRLRHPAHEDTLSFEEETVVTLDRAPHEGPARIVMIPVQRKPIVEVMHESTTRLLLVLGGTPGLLVEAEIRGLNGKRSADDPNVRVLEDNI